MVGLPMTRQTGRTWAAAKRAVELAEKHPEVVVLVPNAQVGKVFARAAYDSMPLGKTKKECDELLGRLKYVSTELGIRGTPDTTPFVADHTWYERYAWIHEAARRERQTRENPQASTRSTAD